jgi:hypothetical protein
MFLGVERQPACKITSPPSMSRLFRQCVTHNISQPYVPPPPATGIALHFIFANNSVPDYWDVSQCERVCSRVKYAVFTAVNMKTAVFWDVTPRDSCKNRNYGGT